MLTMMDTVLVCIVLMVSNVLADIESVKFKFENQSEIHNFLVDIEQSIVTGSVGNIVCSPVYTSGCEVACVKRLECGQAVIILDIKLKDSKFVIASLAGFVSTIVLVIALLVLSLYCLCRKTKELKAARMKERSTTHPVGSKSRERKGTSKPKENLSVVKVDLPKGDQNEHVYCYINEGTAVTY